MKSKRDNLVFIRYGAREYARIANNTLTLHTRVILFTILLLLIKTGLRFKNYDGQRVRRRALERRLARLYA